MPLSSSIIEVVILFISYIQTISFSLLHVPLRRTIVQWRNQQYWGESGRINTKTGKMNKYIYNVNIHIIIMFVVTTYKSDSFREEDKRNLFFFHLSLTLRVFVAHKSSIMASVVN
jgi:hypothetical protein